MCSDVTQLQHGYILHNHPFLIKCQLAIAYMLSLPVVAIRCSDYTVTLSSGMRTSVRCIYEPHPKLVCTGGEEAVMSRRSCICQDKLKGVLVAAGILVISASHLFSGSRATGKFVQLCRSSFADLM